MFGRIQRHKKAKLNGSLYIFFLLPSNESLRIKQGEKRKRCHPNGFPTLISDAFFEQKPNKPQVAFLFAVLLFIQVNKPAMNNRRLLMAAVFHFAHPVLKTSQVETKLCQLQLSK